MNKTFALALVCIIMTFTFIGCKDDRCDICGKKKKNMNAETRKVLTDAGVDGEFCKNHLDEELMKALEKLK